MIDSMDKVKSTVDKINSEVIRILKVNEEEAVKIDFLDSIARVLNFFDDIPATREFVIEKVTELNKILIEQKLAVQMKSENNSLSVQPEGDFQRNMLDDNIELLATDFCVHLYNTPQMDKYLTSLAIDDKIIWMLEESWCGLQNVFEIGNNIQVIDISYNEHLNGYFLVYTSDKIFSKFKQISNSDLSIVKRPYLILPLSIEQMERLILTEDTEIYLENGKKLSDEIERLVIEEDYNINSMPKIKLPYYGQNSFVDKNDEFDIQFCSILSDYIFGLSEIEQNFVFRGMLDKFLIINNSNNDMGALSLRDSINLLRSFNYSGNKRVGYNINTWGSYLYISGRGCFNVNSKCCDIGVELKKGPWQYLIFDIKCGLSSEENIEMLYKYITETPLLPAFRKKLEELEKEAKKYPHCQEFPELIVECTNSLMKLRQFYGNLLERVEELYNKKFGVSFKTRSKKIGDEY